MTVKKEPKPHRTIVITKAMLARRNPCVTGYQFAKRFLPATLSTDPSDNLRLAQRLLAPSDISRHKLMNNFLDWFVNAVGANPATAQPCPSHVGCECRKEGMSNTIPDWLRDDGLMVTQQMLAFVADKLLSNKGL